MNDVLLGVKELGKKFSPAGTRCVLTLSFMMSCMPVIGERFLAWDGTGNPKCLGRGGLEQPVDE